MNALRYLVLARRTAALDAAIPGPRREFLAALRAQGRIELSGPFSDRRGGAYLLRAESIEEARRLVAADPLAMSGAAASTKIRASIDEWSAT